MKPGAFLTKLWIIFTTGTSVIAVASLFDDLIAWIEFIRRFILAYRDIVDSLWAPVLAILKLDLPRWSHDYLTISALTGASILWSLHNTARELGFGGMGSTFGVLWHAFLDFSVGGNTLSLFRQDALDAAAQQPGRRETGVEAIVDRLSRPQRRVVDGVVASLGLVLLAVAAPFLIPLLMSYRDKIELSRAEKLFASRAAEIAGSTGDEALEECWRVALERRAAAFADFRQINSLFYTKVRRNIYLYYAAVGTMFAIVVLVNYGIQRVGDISSAPRPA